MAEAARASLQMYLRPETEGATARLWAGIRAAYGAGDGELSRYDPIDAAWEDPALLLSQTCGLPFRTVLKGKVRLVGTPDYGVPDCPPGYYHSVILTRRDDPRAALAEFQGARLAFNMYGSQSGWAALETHLAEAVAGFTFRDNVLESGAHVASARAVADGKADLASLDAVTWALMERHDPAARKLKVLTRTRPTPGLPFVTGLGVDPAPLFDAIGTAIQDLDPADREALMLRGVVAIPEERYLAEPVPWPLSPPA